MANSLTTILILVVGLSLVLSILLNRLIPHIGSVLLKKSLSVRFPFSKTVDLEIQERDKPKRVILFFGKSTGLYNGNVVIKNGNLEVGSCTLPVLPEYTGAIFGLFGKAFNESVFRYSNTIIVRVQDYKADCPLTLDFNLNQNINNLALREKWKLTDEDEIKIEVRGRHD